MSKFTMLAEGIKISNDITDLKCPECKKPVILATMTPSHPPNLTYKDKIPIERLWKACLINNVTLHCSICYWEQNWNYDEKSRGMIKVG